MAAYKDEKRGTWFVSFHYNDWTGKNCRKVKRGFKTRREAVEWEQHFLMKEGSDLDMTFSEFVAAYTRDMQPKLKHNTWLTKEHIVRTKLLPYFKDKKMRDIKPKDIIQWQNKQISYRDEKGKKYLYDKREKPYEQFISMIYTIMEDTKKSQKEKMSEDEMIQMIYEFSKGLTLWGSNRVVRKWLKYRKNSIQGGTDSLLILEDILYEMRRDVGLKKRMKKGDMLSFFINDIDTLIKKSN